MHMLFVFLVIPVEKLVTVFAVIDVKRGLLVTIKLR